MNHEKGSTFSALPIGRKFWAHGRMFIKTSSTGARMDTTGKRQSFAGILSIILE